MRSGRVRVNGEVASELGMRVVSGLDVVELDGEVVTLPKELWVAFWKPSGVLTTRRDPHGGTTVYDVLPGELRGLKYVGRLDRDAEGLLLLTNDGDGAHRLQHPSSQVEREYRVEVAGSVGAQQVKELLQGIQLDDGIATARSARVLEGGAIKTRMCIVLTEGRKREVRRMLSALGHPVLRLRRVRFGSVTLDRLEPGEWRYLDQAETDRITD
ncbi:uncharacterized protein METZ01_LOCUS358478 [marine metagenome]|uniref:Pseudouridine synthase RsuA/RluA-like domain-containing protein n=1 Tax=marine metagenome TaxID=408172 RepID=A0A382S6V8_9ZZZZ